MLAFVCLRLRSRSLAPVKNLVNQGFTVDDDGDGDIVQVTWRSHHYWSTTGKPDAAAGTAAGTRHTIQTKHSQLTGGLSPKPQSSHTAAASSIGLLNAAIRIRLQRTRLGSHSFPPTGFRSRVGGSGSASARRYYRVRRSQGPSDPNERGIFRMP